MLARGSASSRQARFAANSTFARSASTRPAAPMPTASTSWSTRSCPTTSTTTSATWLGSWLGVRRRTIARTSPDSSTTPAATFVPPMSIPIARLTWRRPRAGRSASVVGWARARRGRCARRRLFARPAWSCVSTTVRSAAIIDAEASARCPKVSGWVRRSSASSWQNGQTWHSAPVADGSHRDAAGSAARPLADRLDEPGGFLGERARARLRSRPHPHVGVGPEPHPEPTVAQRGAVDHAALQRARQRERRGGASRRSAPGRRPCATRSIVAAFGVRKRDRHDELVGCHPLHVSGSGVSTDGERVGRRRRLRGELGQRREPDRLRRGVRRAPDRQAGERRRHLRELRRAAPRPSRLASRRAPRRRQGRPGWRRRRRPGSRAATAG